VILDRAELDEAGAAERIRRASRAKSRARRAAPGELGPPAF